MGRHRFNVETLPNPPGTGIRRTGELTGWAAGVPIEGSTGKGRKNAELTELRGGAISHSHPLHASLLLHIHVFEPRSLVSGPHACCSKLCYNPRHFIIPGKYPLIRSFNTAFELCLVWLSG